MPRGRCRSGRAGPRGGLAGPTVPATMGGMPARPRAAPRARPPYGRPNVGAPSHAPPPHAPPPRASPPRSVRVPYCGRLCPFFCCVRGRRRPLTLPAPGLRPWAPKALALLCCRPCGHATWALPFRSCWPPGRPGRSHRPGDDGRYASPPQGRPAGAPPVRAPQCGRPIQGRRPHYAMQARRSLLYLHVNRVMRLAFLVKLCVRPVSIHVRPIAMHVRSNMFRVRSLTPGRLAAAGRRGGRAAGTIAARPDETFEMVGVF